MERAFFLRVSRAVAVNELKYDSFVFSVQIECSSISEYSEKIIKSNHLDSGESCRGFSWWHCHSINNHKPPICPRMRERVQDHQRGKEKELCFMQTRSNPDALLCSLCRCAFTCLHLFVVDSSMLIVQTNLLQSRLLCSCQITASQTSLSANVLP